MRRLLALGASLSLPLACGGGSPHVVVVGDSLTFQADGNRDADDANGLLLAELEDGGYTAEGGGIIGLDLPSAHRSLWPTVEDQEPDVLVIALGTNDSHDGASPLGTSEQVLTTWLDEVPETCVVLVGVNETATAWGLDVHGPPFNAMLDDLAADRSNVHVVRWEPEPGMLDDDGIHLSDDGQAAYRQSIVEAATGCPSSQ